MIYKKKLIELLCVSFFSISASVPLIQQYSRFKALQELALTLVSGFI